MCGIVGYIGAREALPFIIEGLEKLEYRGYDSAGVAILQGGEVVVTRALGKLAALKATLAERNGFYTGSIGIGHTRWATHGKPSENNAHPHTAGRVSLIHNGIIENYSELREELRKKGCVFKSETDTEVGAHLLSEFLKEGLEPMEALRQTCGKIRGSYAFLAIDSDHPDRILVAKNATPIVIGVGEGERIIASDIPAVLATTRTIIVLEDGDLAEIRADGVFIENGGVAVTREQQRVTWDPVTAQKGGFKHFMLKEIHEQSQAIADTLRGRLEHSSGNVTIPEFSLTDEQIRQVDRIVLVACGTAWHSCLVAKFYLENLAGIPCDVDYASEFRYRKPLLNERSLVIAISQSGETADTLAAIELANLKKAKTLSICNVLGSSIARKVGSTIFTHAGPEISVASTKAFATQLTAAYLLALYLGQVRGTLSVEDRKRYILDLVRLPAVFESALERSIEPMEQLAREFHSAQDFLYIARGACYPIALEGALKLKEISYIHAEGYPAGELKHGPIALIDEKMPVVVILQRSDEIFEKVFSNLREVESRGGKVIAITDTEGVAELKNTAHTVLELPFLSPLLSPIILTVPLQLLAYNVAVFKGTDVDLPRNLAKSVTVE